MLKIQETRFQDIGTVIIRFEKVDHYLGKPFRLPTNLRLSPCCCYQKPYDLSASPAPLGQDPKHFIADLDGAGEPGLKEALRCHEPLLPRLKVAQRDALGPAARGERELEVVAAERDVLDGDAEGLVEALLVAEEGLGHAQPHAEDGRRADHVVVGHDAQGRPAVHHGQ